ncbi:response regulator aspartate phosphatase B/response regulator aspartate phosphatase J [Alkalihalobacillus xiaoxiensis]|uniref:Response regulator aspartate phosphatase B/response regulator aspartate phosphatase J n=1 Tax=Shouchella xiaoxiensis TaxID=766895 RepID=A0ABS2SYE6_9BACI|nr:tetratricopeptide repeat protein [Shouchella xiaoxiensis]MBM7840561.1 response regulator aspartate phosphatase B/response regulator aspartate phosphatase J [Shouchella xiaoxiensis]
MIETKPSEEVGAKIVEWYSCIIARSIDEAVLLHDEIKQMLKTMEPSDSILAYYSLVEYRYTMMRDQATNEQAGEEMIERVSSTIDESVDHMLRYMYYFVSGQHEFMHHRYRSAIRLFRKAERLLEYVNDEAEEAEFQYYMGMALMQIGHNAYACSYLEEAIVMFKRLGYTERIIFSTNILAGIYSISNIHDKAKEILDENISLSANFPYSSHLVTFTMGINAYREKDYYSAKRYFEQNISSVKFKNYLVTAKARYCLARVLFMLGYQDEGEKELKQAIEDLEQNNSKEFLIRCNILKKIFVEKDFIGLDQEFDVLEEQNMLYACEELSEELATIFHEKQELEKALSYMKRAYRAKQKTLSLGVGLD